MSKPNNKSNKSNKQIVHLPTTYDNKPAIVASNNGTIFNKYPDEVFYPMSNNSNNSNNSNKNGGKRHKKRHTRKSHKHRGHKHRSKKHTRKH